MVGAYCLLAPKSSRHLEPGLLNAMGVVSNLRAGSRRLTIPLVFLACVVLLAGCGGSSPTREARVKTSRVDVSRLSPAIAGISKDRVFVWGGRSLLTFSAGNLATGKIFSTGEIISLPDGKSSPVPASPFKERVAYERAAASGDRVLVVGKSCRKWGVLDVLDVNGGFCGPGSLVGAIYDANSETWLPVDFEPGAAEAMELPTHVDVSDQGVALVSSWRQPDVLIMVDLVSAKARRLPDPPVGLPEGWPTGGTEGCWSLCKTVTDSYVVSATRVEENKVSGFPLGKFSYTTLSWTER